MSSEYIHRREWNPWQLTTIGMAVAFATALATGVVVAHYVAAPKPEVVASAPSRPVGAQHAAARPGSADIEACNQYASSSARDKTTETLTDALIGGAVGAGVGAAGGAIAGGGSGAGKGAGIGGLVGATAGTLYGLNNANQNDQRAAAAYRACMRRRGYND